MSGVDDSGRAGRFICLCVCVRGGGLQLGRGGGFC